MAFLKSPIRLSRISLAFVALSVLLPIVQAHGGGAKVEEEVDPKELGCYDSGVDEWDRGLQIGAVFIILAICALGVLTPVLTRYVSWINVPQSLLDTGKFFGAGVIVATALIHMLASSGEAFEDPCVGDRLGDYEGWPFCIAMLAILAMHLMEYLMSAHSMKSCKAKNLVGEPPSDKLAASVNDDNGQETPSHSMMHQGHTHLHGGIPVSFDHDDESIANARLHTSTLILELGIALHSVIIGLSLAISSGTEFKTLLIALSFHQFFEGVALGSRLASLKYKRNPFLQALLNGCFFMITTPLGQVIGIAIRQSYAPRAPSTLLAQGALDALSGGILLYSGIVNFLVEEFTSSKFHDFSRIRKVISFAAMYIGAGAMALIGKWA
ncbi:hypothetical protein H4219_001709 [Mycoemilia scoparia]|uniref:Uncharacterized protein n=1 Tax=Mycoemilia scoparia TaxID=417184 RepID=A0A9W8DRK9_9FUNG|nr:hypothetical protein H4219_001709 [Mycoemilia scoparia]